MDATMNRLISFYKQLPASKRQPYGKWIVAMQNGTYTLTQIQEEVRCWWDRCRVEYEVKGNQFWGQDFAAAGCMTTILKNNIN